MNKLPIDKRVQIINLLVEGSSLRATSRIADVSINTVTKLLVDVGTACQQFHDETVKGIQSQRVQADEIWSFVYSKEKNKLEGMKDIGDVWTWTAIDADHKLIISWLVGSRDADTATVFMKDVAARLGNKVQLTTDGLHVYLSAVNTAFPADDEKVYAQLIKLYGPEEDQSITERKYSSSKCTEAEKKAISGEPYPFFISTYDVERQNLTMRMHMSRFTQLTNAFSKKLENHCHAIALHFVYYNFVRIHKTLRVPPALQAGLIKRLMTIEDIVRLAD